MKYLVVLFCVFSPLTGAVNDWSGPRKVEIIDTLDDSVGANKSLITLEGFVDAQCSNNRVALTSENPDHYKEMMSFLLSAFHANTEINIYVNSICEGTRVQLTKN